MNATDLPERILRLLTSRYPTPQNATEIAEALADSRMRVLTQLKALRADGRVRPAGSGLFTLSKAERITRRAQAPQRPPMDSPAPPPVVKPQHVPQARRPARQGLEALRDVELPTSEPDASEDPTVEGIDPEAAAATLEPAEHGYPTTPWERKATGVTREQVVEAARQLGTWFKRSELVEVLQPGAEGELLERTNTGASYHLKRLGRDGILDVKGRSSGRRYRIRRPFEPGDPAVTREELRLQAKADEARRRQIEDEAAAIRRLDEARAAKAERLEAEARERREAAASPLERARRIVATWLRNTHPDVQGKLSGWDLRALEHQIAEEFADE